MGKDVLSNHDRRRADDAEWVSRIASEAATKAVHDTLKVIGFDVNNPYAIQADQLYLRKARVGADEVSRWIKRGAVGIILATVAWIISQGLTTWARGGG